MHQPDATIASSIGNVCVNDGKFHKVNEECHHHYNSNDNKNHYELG